MFFIPLCSFEHAEISYYQSDPIDQITHQSMTLHLEIFRTSATSCASPSHSNAEIVTQRTHSHPGHDSQSRLPSALWQNFPSLNMIGAPNFRQAADAKIFGLGQPSSTGCQAVCHFLQQQADHASQSEEMLWTNLREEPFVYINDSPYVIRDVQHPLQSSKAFSGITAARLEAIEDRLVADVKNRSRRRKYIDPSAR